MYKICLVIALLCTRLFTPCFGQEQEYQIKSVFLEQFTRFIEWPETSEVSDTLTPFVIAVIGENPFGSILEKTFAKQKIKNSTVEIRYLSTPNEISNCHILFISKSNKNILPDILSHTEGKPILTISDTEGFAQENVLINFYLYGNKIKFEINEKAVHESGFDISYILFNLAKVVNPIKGKQ